MEISIAHEKIGLPSKIPSQPAKITSFDLKFADTQLKLGLYL